MPTYRMRCNNNYVCRVLLRGIKWTCSTPEVRVACFGRAVIQEDINTLRSEKRFDLVNPLRPESTRSDDKVRERWDLG